MLRRFADWLYRQGTLTKAKIQGFEFGVVVDTEDPWQLGRIRVRFPWHYDGDMSDWALPANANLSDETGSTFGIPQVDDLVLCVFYGGDVTRPAYLGSIWTGGGIGPRGKIEARKPLIKGYQPQDPNPDTYDHNIQPDLTPKNYSEPPDGAWVSNDPNTRVHEFKTYGGLRLLWEEMKRRLRIWTHPTSAFKVEVDHFDGDSVQPPRAVPYHRGRVESPKGTYFEVEEDDNLGEYRTTVFFHTGHKIEFVLTPAEDYVKVTDVSGEEVFIDNLNQFIRMKDRAGGQVLLDVANGIRKMEDPSGQSFVLTENTSLKVTSPFTVTVEAAGDLAVTSTGGNLSLTAPSGTVTIDGSTINIG